MAQSRGKPLHKISCKDCGSSDGKQVFVQEDGKQNAYCFACETYDSMQDTTKIKYKQQTCSKSLPPKWDMNNPTTDNMALSLRKGLIQRQ